MLFSRLPSSLFQYFSYKHKKLKPFKFQQHLEEAFTQELDKADNSYGGSYVVPIPSDALHRDFTGSTRSSLSSFSEG